jgi:WS/DGAT/MGAT family acyltransferase
VQTRTHYERLSALDASFLDWDEPNARWHEGAVMVFERGPLGTPDGAVDADRIAQAYAASFDRVERYRQRIARIPFFDHPVWVDDPRFDVRYHIRHVALPPPGSERQLKRVCGYLLSQPLDLARPPWEVWVVDGLEDGGFALVTKTHHCMIDGASGMTLLAALLRAEPDATAEAPRPWTPRPPPSGAELVAGELARRLGAPLALAAPLRDPRRALRGARDVVQGIAEAARLGWSAASATVFNPEQIGPHRRFDWTVLPLDEIKAVKNRLGGTVNDVVLATAAGALGAFLRAHRTPMRNLDFRVLLPVSVRSEQETSRLGNRVAMMMAELPVGERDPRRRLARTVETTRRLKQSKQALGVRWLEEFFDLVGGRLFVELSRSATRSRPFNVALTNVPGPREPLYLLGARMRSILPMVPLFSNQALGVAVVSYAGRVFWGFNSDWDTLPDLHDLVDQVGVQFEELRKAAEQGPLRPARRRAAARS